MPPRPLIGLMCRLCLLAGCCGLAGGSAASDTLVLDLGDIQAAGWRAEGVRASVDLHSSAARLTINRLYLPPPIGLLSAVSLSCARSRLSGRTFSCEGGRARLRHPALAAREFGVALHYRRGDDTLRFDLRGLPIAGGELDVHGRGGDGRWRLRGHGEKLELAGLLALIPADAPPLRLSGRTGVDFDLAVAGGRIGGAIKLDLRQAQLSAAGGRLATEGLDLDLDIYLRPDSQGLTVRAEARARRGQLYVEPVFVDAGEHPFRLSAQARWNGKVLDIAGLNIEQPGALTASGYLSYSREEGLREAGLFIEESRLSALYALYMQPFLIGTPLDDLNLSGELRGELRWADGAPQRIALRLTQAGLKNAQGRLSIQGLAGEIHWSPRPPAAGVRDSYLSWREGEWRGASFGPASLPLRLVGRDLVLLEPVRLPVLDGALMINALEARSLGLPAMQVDLDGRLAPIDLGRLSTALGWPEFSGTLAGQLPSLRYRASQLTLEGPLRIEAFDGRIEVNGLRLWEPLGPVPRLLADVRLRNLDLKELTDAFSFGRIEGRLDGDIEQLRLVNWRPADFDAHFYTPRDDRSRHRISQRAIENISNIGGGGPGGVLSRTFLRFFENFSYDRIGISCRLHEDVCIMGGLGPAEDGRGYYLVRGRWLPRVDVIGYQRQVSWPTLVEQIQSVLAADELIVK